MEISASSGWNLISVTAQQWLEGSADRATLISAVKEADVSVVAVDASSTAVQKSIRTSLNVLTILNRLKFSNKSKTSFGRIKIPLEVLFLYY